jgi:hypothetical protein
MTKTLSSLLIILLIGSQSLLAEARDMKPNSCEGHLQYKEMDRNNDGEISKAEFLKFHEDRFDKIKQKNGTINLEKVDKDTHNSSMNKKALGTTTDNPEVNDRDATNGSKY